MPLFNSSEIESSPLIKVLSVQFNIDPQGFLSNEALETLISASGKIIYQVKYFNTFS
jgi:hypothetical protein